MMQPLPMMASCATCTPSIQQVVTAHYGFAFSRCTTIDGYIIANGVVITYFGSRVFTAEFQILGNSAYNSSRKNGVAVIPMREPYSILALGMIVLLSPITTFL